MFRTIGAQTQSNGLWDFKKNCWSKKHGHNSERFPIGQIKTWEVFLNAFL